MKQTLNNILNQNATSVIVVVLVCAFTGLLLGCFGYVVSFLVTITAIWSTEFNFKRFGINSRSWLSVLKKAFIYAILMFIVVDVLFSPVAQHLIGPLEVWNPYLLIQSPVAFVIISLSILVLTVIGEELVYRGYFMKRLAKSLGGSDASWLFSAVIISSTIGTIGIYDGVSGMLINGITCFLLCMIFFINRRNLQLCMLIHAIHDLSILTLIFFGKEQSISNWMLNLPLN